MCCAGPCPMLTKVAESLTRGELAPAPPRATASVPLPWGGTRRSDTRPPTETPCVSGWPPLMMTMTETPHWPVTDPCSGAVASHDGTRVPRAPGRYPMRARPTAACASRRRGAASPGRRACWTRRARACPRSAGRTARPPCATGRDPRGPSVRSRPWGQGWRCPPRGGLCGTVEGTQPSRNRRHGADSLRKSAVLCGTWAEHGIGLAIGQ